MPFAFTDLYNAAEVALWFVLGIGFLIGAIYRKGHPRVMAILSGLIFLAFSASDLIEIQTGAWWRPWWLLAWKGGCVAGLIVLYVIHVRKRIR